MYLFKKSAFWLGIFALVLILVYIFINPYGIKTLLAICNAPLYLLTGFVLHWDILPPNTADMLDKIPFGLVYVASFVGYGILIDFIFNKLKSKQLIENPSVEYSHQSVRKICGVVFIVVSLILLAAFILTGLKYYGEALDIIAVKKKVDIACFCFWPAIILLIKGIHLIIPSRLNPAKKYTSIT